MRTIILIQLQGSRYFLCSREETELLSPIRLFLELTVQYDFLKTYKPVSICEKWTDTHPTDLDTHVKKQMLIHGIDNVRGGSYSQPFLTVHQISLLKTEIYGNTQDDSDSVIKEIVEMYGKRAMTNEELKTELDELTRNYEKYKGEKEMLDTIWVDISAAHVDIRWLETMCETQKEEWRNRASNVGLATTTPIYRLEYQENVKIYRRVLRLLWKMYSIVINILEHPYVVTNKNIQYPQFLFDDFMYHGYFTHFPKMMDMVSEVCSTYRFFVTVIENRIAELEFDIKTWGENTDLRFRYSIALLELCSPFTFTI